MDNENRGETTVPEQLDKAEPTLRIQRQGDTVELHFSGDWSIPYDPPNRLDVATSPAPSRVVALPVGLTEWGSSLLVVLEGVREQCAQAQVPLDTKAMPEGVRRLLALAAAVPEREGARRTSRKTSFISSLGENTIQRSTDFRDGLHFVGECTIAFGRLLIGKARVRRCDVLEMIYAAGPQALGIITVISVLVGMIVAFMGAVQLQMFGAEIYVADMVSLGMTREMGALMTGIIIAGRTGAAYAAQLGTMQVNEEIDALKTCGFSPIEFLVLPRLIALILMTPLLTIYANILGIIGGAIIGVTMLDIGVVQYWNQTVASMGIDDAASGIVKSIIFGILVAVAGCMRGIQCGRNASAVGDAATRAVVSGIVYIIVADAALSITFMIIGF